jgi:hypothetical protein
MFLNLTKDDKDFELTGSKHSPVFESPNVCFPPRKHPVSNQDHVGFVVNKVGRGQVSPEYFDFPCKFSFHQIFRILITLSSKLYNLI